MGGRQESRQACRERARKGGRKAGRQTHVHVGRQAGREAGRKRGRKVRKDDTQGETEEVGQAWRKGGRQLWGERKKRTQAGGRAGREEGWSMSLHHAKCPMSMHVLTTFVNCIS